MACGCPRWTVRSRKLDGVLRFFEFWRHLSADATIENSWKVFENKNKNLSRRNVKDLVKSIVIKFCLIVGF